MLGIPIALIIAIVAVVIVVIVAAVITKNYIKVPPDELAVFTGVGKGKIVSGGGRIRIPGITVVNEMSLAPHTIQVDVRNVFSSDGTPVNVTGVGIVNYGRSEEELTTVAGMYLRTPREELDRQVSEILASVARSVVSSMTVEQLNNERVMVSSKIVEAGSEAYSPNGMVINTFTIQNLSDDNGYLDALGATRNAEVKRDAAIGKANADRDAAIQAAIAQRESKVKQAEATAEIAEAEKTRDLALAAIKAEVDAENAKSAQQGPLADAKAKAEVEVAQAEADRRSEEARIEVEQQRALRAAEAQNADIIIPAEAQRKASVIKAEGDRDAAKFKAEAAKDTTIAEAQATAEQTKLSSESEAEATKVRAKARQEELEAEALGDLAKLKAEAEGRKELADALNAFSDEAARLQVLPDLIKTLPEVAKAVAGPLSQIDRIVVLGGSDGNSGISGVSGMVPQLITQSLEALSASGVDLGELLNKRKGAEGKELVSAPTGTPDIAAGDSQTIQSDTN